MSNSSVPSLLCPPAAIDWYEQGQPLSRTFDDVYFSTVDGLAECRHVFLQPSQLSTRWQQLTPTDRFTVAETGFGSGLNFLATHQLWHQHAPQQAELHYLSVEKYPLTINHIKKNLTLFSELQPFADALIEQYPRALNPGFHRLEFSLSQQRRIHLTLIFADAEQGLAQCLGHPHPIFRAQTAKVDAWFLDGFSPSKNPDIWTPNLFNSLRELSKAGTTVATFTAASMVRRSLENEGFNVSKASGFGKKREMLSAYLEKATYESSQTPSPNDYPNSPRRHRWPVPWWYCAPWHSASLSVQSSGVAPAAEKRALIIGAGLAGCHTAYQLARRGWQVTLIDQHEQVAAEGSGNHQGALYAKLSHRRETLGDFNLHCLQYAQRFYRQFWQQDPFIGQACGVVQLALTDKARQQQSTLLQAYPNDQQTVVRHVSAAEASQLANTPVSSDGLFYPQAGWLNPKRLCQQLIDHPNIKHLRGQRVEQLSGPLENTTNQWQALNDQNQIIATGDIAVITCAASSRHFEQTKHLPLKPVRGQVSYIDLKTHESSGSTSPSLPSAPFHSTSPSAALSTVLCGKGYVCPPTEQRYCFGASFAVKDTDISVRDNDHNTNVRNLHECAPELTEYLQQQAQHNGWQGRVSFRCASPDYLPLVGPAPIAASYQQQFALLKRNAKAAIVDSGDNHKGLYVSTGYGSRGLTYIPLCTELLISQIEGSPRPVDHALQENLHPGRFLIRELIRNNKP